MDDKKMNLSLRGDLVAWTQFAAALRGISVTRYINAAIEADMERADASTLAAYEAFKGARPEEG